ncbi:hypothetical protein PN488_02990 [Nodularia spumigena CS-591/12]|nr:hypothetical protein [Nodularia spumigena]MDB9303353.1 hypothetical protein [Nodularia spumigena CS-591/12]MDB9353782.1 hypothetical protein [Nodularia spumigena CS-588/05]
MTNYDIDTKLHISPGDRRRVSVYTKKIEDFGISHKKVIYELS